MRTYYGRIGFKRTAGRRGEAGPDGAPKKLFVLEKTSLVPLGIENVNHGQKNIFKPNAGTKSAVDKRFIAGL